MVEFVKSPMRHVRCIVDGRVQGVGFRYATQREARRLGIVGWARNLADGTVEVAASGTSEAVAELLEWLEEGPAFAIVASVSSTDIELDQPLAEFEIR